MKKIRNYFEYLISRYIKSNFGRLRFFCLVRLMKVRPIKIIIGASTTSQKKWIETNIGYLNLLKEKDWERNFPQKNIDAILAEHVWEHLTKEEAREAARRCFEYLKSGGYLRVSVPDGASPDKDYVEYVKPGGFGPGSDDHKILYTHKTLKEIFESAGFSVNLLEYFNENGEFIYNKWRPEEGKIVRSRYFDKRNREGRLVYSSIILDAKKNIIREKEGIPARPFP